MSSFLYRLRFLELQRQIIDECNYGGYDLEFSNDMESKINNVISDLNDHFQNMIDSRKKTSRPSDIMFSERVLCQVVAQGLILQLNRPFLLRSYHDNRYVSKQEPVQGYDVHLYLLPGTSTRSMYQSGTFDTSALEH
jgi:hypothetical protein